jgi:hypothetical protein
LLGAVLWKEVYRESSLWYYVSDWIYSKVAVGLADNEINIIVTHLMTVFDCDSCVLIALLVGYAARVAASFNRNDRR